MSKVSLEEIYFMRNAINNKLYEYMPENYWLRTVCKYLVIQIIYYKNSGACFLRQLVIQLNVEQSKSVFSKQSLGNELFTEQLYSTVYLYFFSIFQRTLYFVYGTERMQKLRVSFWEHSY